MSMQKQFVYKLFASQVTCCKRVLLPSRHHAHVATAVQKMQSAPALPQPFLHQTVDAFDMEPEVQPPMPKWKKAGLQIERNCSDYIYQKIVKEIVDRYGWDNSVYDYAMWHKVFGPNFSMFFALDKNREPMACQSMALYPQVAHWSMYYVKDDYRGHQLGRALTCRNMQLPGDRPIFCYGVADMWFKYAEDYGLHHLLDWRLWSLAANCADVRPERLDDDSSVLLKEWRAVSFDKLLSFDLAKIAVSKETGEVVGTCQARHLLNRRVGISLFYAENASIASALLRAVLLQFAGPDPSTKYDKLIYKTPSNNTDSVRLFRQLIQNGPVERQVLTPQFSRYSLPFPGQRIFSISDEHVSLI
uniref:N-acetyltransferase domain-containing protein n=1 Tax=Globodera rostochiensis TaxID=31243 RepID=A0A914IBK9_GLORO